jgi:hypothetical protein
MRAPGLMSVVAPDDGARRAIGGYESARGRRAAKG